MEKIVYVEWDLLEYLWRREEETSKVCRDGGNEAFRFDDTLVARLLFQGQNQKKFITFFPYIVSIDYYSFFL